MKPVVETIRENVDDVFYDIVETLSRVWKTKKKKKKIDSRWKQEEQLSRSCAKCYVEWGWAFVAGANFHKKASKW